MKHQTYFMIIAICSIQFFSCHRNSYNDEDLVNRYLQEHAHLFDAKETFYLLVFQTPPFTCYQERQRLDFEVIVPQLFDSLNNPIMVMISSNNQTVARFDSLFSTNKSFDIRYEQPDVLDAYGFSVTPQLFKIENLVIREWMSFPTEVYGCW